jgi:hypothetical protein
VDGEHAEQRARQVAEQAARDREQRLLGEHRAAHLPPGRADRAEQREPAAPQVDRQRRRGGQREHRGNDEYRDHRAAERVPVGDLDRESRVGQLGPGVAGGDGVPGAAVQAGPDPGGQDVRADPGGGLDGDQVHHSGADGAAGEPGLAGRRGDPGYPGELAREAGGHAPVGLQRDGLRLGGVAAAGGDPQLRAGGHHHVGAGQAAER